MRKLFTKSAFKVALTCPAQLYYYFDKDNYPNKNADNEFMKSLAEGGFQVGELAKMYLGVNPENDLSGLGGYELPLQKTESIFSQGDVTIAEAAFKYGDCFVRTDIVRKNGNRIDLIEVKAKSWESGRSFTRLNRSHVEVVESEIQEYMYEVAFQKYVLEHALSHHEIIINQNGSNGDL